MILAEIHFDRERYEIAVDLMESVVARTKRIFPPGHYDRWYPSLLLAEMYLSRGRREEAEALAIEYLAESAALHTDAPRPLHLLDRVIRPLVVAADPGPRDPRALAATAELLVARPPRPGEHWSTLGIARYRAGDWAGANEAFDRSDPHVDGAVSATNDLFRAMALRRLGGTDRALAPFDRAVAWLEEHAPDDPKLNHVHAEAEALLRPLLVDAAFPADPFARGR
jgi:hypothetical protein